MTGSAFFLADFLSAAWETTPKARQLTKTRRGRSLIKGFYR
jgi:hypothetical protein